jgi:hypothetical protein
MESTEGCPDGASSCYVVDSDTMEGDYTIIVAKACEEISGVPMNYQLYVDVESYTCPGPEECTPGFLVAGVDDVVGVTVTPTNTESGITITGTLER